MEKFLDDLNESSDLENLIKLSKNDTSKCDKKVTEIHKECLVSDNGNLKSLCPGALIQILTGVLASKPNLINDNVKDDIATYFKMNNIKAQGLVSPNILNTLFQQTKSQLMTWLKYETLLCYLIKEHIYEPKTMANEVLATVKSELQPEIASRFSSVINSCVSHCRKASNLTNDDEDEQKWCEIIDWISWFIVSKDEGFS